MLQVCKRSSMRIFSTLEFRAGERAGLVFGETGGDERAADASHYDAHRTAAIARMSGPILAISRAFWPSGRSASITRPFFVGFAGARRNLRRNGTAMRISSVRHGASTRRT